MPKYDDSKNITHLKDFFRRHGRLPSYKELLFITGFSSRASVFGLINRLVARGIIAKDDEGHLSPGAQFFARPRLGIVEAGFGYDADAIEDDAHAIDNYLIEKPEATFLLTVKGESMIEAGILPGDVVVAERRNEAKNGEIVVAEVDGSWTMKYYRNENGKILLIPANHTMKPYTPKQSLSIAAVVRGVVRKYS